VRVTNTDALQAVFATANGVTFPGSAEASQPNLAGSYTTWVNREQGSPPLDLDAPLALIFARFVDHTDFEPTWPIRVDFQLVLRGLRRSLSMSQVAFAEACEVATATVERWEAGTTIPFKGDAIELLGRVRPHVTTPVQAGQLLNVAAAAVCWRLSQPTARYAGSEIATWLDGDSGSHSDLAEPLLEALIHSNILIPVDSAGHLRVDDDYFPLAGSLQAKPAPAWHRELIQAARDLTDSDRQMVLTLIHRLSRTE
jgi:DNA-binding XRE family transcriptional regulator